VRPLRVVTNAGPLIYLAILGRFDLLRGLFGGIYLPRAVYHEVVIQGIGQPGADETREGVSDGSLRLVDVQNRIAVDALLGELDLGEAETIVLARELNLGWVLLDDGAARARARLMGLGVTGTIGVLLLARRAGIEIDLQHDLGLLIAHNFRLARDLYDMLTTGSR